MSYRVIGMCRGAYPLFVLLVAFAAVPSVAADDAGTATMLQDAAQGAKEKRYTAIDDLGERHAHASQVVPKLAKMLDDADPNIRWRTARTLGEYGAMAVEAGPGLRQLLADKDPIVQYHAAIAIGKLGDNSDEAVDALLAVATSKDGRVARAAISAIRMLKPGPKRVAEALARALKSNDHAVTMHALETIVEQGAKRRRYSRKRSASPRRHISHAPPSNKLGPMRLPRFPNSPHFWARRSILT